MMNEAEREIKLSALAIQLHRKLAELNEEVERLISEDPLTVYNDILKLKSLVGQAESISYQYRRLS